MAKIRAHIKTSFGKLEIEGESAQELLEALKNVTPKFIEEVSGLVAVKVSPIKAQLEGLVELTTEGPVITTRVRITHYEAIGLVLYASDKRTNTATQVNRLLGSSGIKCMVPARLNEMTKRGLVFKPDRSRPEYRLTVQGERWIEDEVLTKLRSAG